MAETIGTVLGELATQIEGSPAPWSSEEELQLHLGQLLLPSGFQREVVAGTDRFDLYRSSDQLVIEVKIEGTPAAVLRQLLRYASREDVAGMLLVTTRPTHYRAVPEFLGGKPVEVARLWSWGVA